MNHATSGSGSILGFAVTLLLVAFAPLLAGFLGDVVAWPLAAVMLGLLAARLVPAAGHLPTAGVVAGALAALANAWGIAGFDPAGRGLQFATALLVTFATVQGVATGLLLRHRYAIPHAFCGALALALSAATVGITVAEHRTGVQAQTALDAVWADWRNTFAEALTAMDDQDAERTEQTLLMLEGIPPQGLVSSMLALQVVMWVLFTGYLQRAPRTFRLSSHYRLEPPHLVFLALAIITELVWALMRPEVPWLIPTLLVYAFAALVWVQALALISWLRRRAWREGRPALSLAGTLLVLTAVLIPQIAVIAGILDILHDFRNLKHTSPPES